MTKHRFSNYGKDLFLSSSERKVGRSAPNQSQNNTSSCNNSLNCRLVSMVEKVS